jgi:Domain of unknown function (DUF1887)
MGKKKALLTLFGGRSFLPTALIIIHEKPDVVIAISSKQSYEDLPQLQRAIDKFKKELDFQCLLETPDGIDAFDVEKIQKVCEKTFEKHADLEWIFDITGGTSLMSIAAYETARKFRDELKKTVNCWYLNTAQTRVIRLVGEKREASIFHISVDAYAAAYKHTLKPGIFEGIQYGNKQGWLSFAQKLGKNPSPITLLKQVMNKIIDRPAINTPKSYSLPGLSEETYTLLDEAQQVGLLSQLKKELDSSIAFKLSYPQDKFLNGAWLEAYTWDEARNLKDETEHKSLFDDCRWNQILDGDTNNELDVAITYKAQLIIAECKTGEKGTFSSDTVYKWDSVANSLGGKFVGKLLITSLHPSDVTKQAYTDFIARAESKSIVVVTRDQLPNIGSILEKQAKNPTYPRI